MIGTSNQKIDGLPEIHGVEAYAVEGKILLRLGTVPVDRGHGIEYALEPIDIVIENPKVLRRLALAGLEGADRVEEIQESKNYRVGREA